MFHMLKNYVRAATDVLFPPLCFLCETKTNGNYLCLDCQEKIEFLWPPVCRYCSIPIENNKTGLCKSCIGKMYPYDRVISITAYKGPMAELIQLFKYNNYDYLIELFSALMIKHLLRIGFNLSSYDIITSVPLHISKLKDRGYNQSSILAKSLANYFKIPFRDDIIYEKNQRISQTKLEKKEREENVRGAFLVKDAVIDKKIIIVDDIFTTGSTLKECSISFKEKGAKNITAITLSKTL